MIWEITHRCNLRCLHCLVDGGPPGDEELSTNEALEVADQIAELGASVVILTGGEPLLRDDWEDIASRISERGMALRFSANGHRVDNAMVTRLEELGTDEFAVSVDGLKESHDRLRVGHGSGGASAFDEAMDALDRLRPSTIRSGAITTVTRQNLDELEAIHALLVEHGVSGWMVQLAHRTGRLLHSGATAPEPIKPSELPHLANVLVRIGKARRLRLLVHNTIGYLSKDEPLLLRPGPSRRLRFWSGCTCGRSTLGIAPNGDVKGCANQVSAPFIVGNLRTEELAAIWNDRERWCWLDPRPEQMGGACAGCALSGVCKAGCTALAYSASGELFNNPYCLRALQDRTEELTS